MKERVDVVLLDEKRNEIEVDEEESDLVVEFHFGDLFPIQELLSRLERIEHILGVFLNSPFASHHLLSFDLLGGCLPHLENVYDLPQVVS